MIRPIQLKDPGRLNNQKLAAKHHDITIDNKGKVYLGDISGNRVQKFKVKLP